MKFNIINREKQMEGLSYKEVYNMVKEALKKEFG